MFDRFTDRARKVMGVARQEAGRLKHEYIGTEHFLLGLIQEESGVAANVLRNLDVSLSRVRVETDKLVQSGKTDSHICGQLPFTPRAKNVLEFALEEASQLGHNYIGTEHLLLGLMRDEDGIASQVLLNLGVKLEAVREEVLELLGAEHAKKTAGIPDDAVEHSVSFSIDLGIWNSGDALDLAKKGLAMVVAGAAILDGQDAAHIAGLTLKAIKDMEEAKVVSASAEAKVAKSEDTKS